MAAECGYDRNVTWLNGCGIKIIRREWDLPSGMPDIYSFKSDGSMQDEKKKITRYGS